MRAARGKYSVPTHAREFVAYRGETGSRAVGTRSERPWMDRRLGVELAGPSPTPGSRFSSLSLSLSALFLPPPMDQCGGGAGGDRTAGGETPSDRDGPGGRYSSPVPPLRAPGRCFSFLPSSFQWLALVAPENPKDDRFSPRCRCRRT